MSSWLDVACVGLGLFERGTWHLALRMVGLSEMLSLPMQPRDEMIRGSVLFSLARPLTRDGRSCPGLDSYFPPGGGRFL